MSGLHLSGALGEEDMPCHSVTGANWAQTGESISEEPQAEAHNHCVYDITIIHRSLCSIVGRS